MVKTRNRLLRRLGVLLLLVVSLFLVACNSEDSQSSAQPGLRTWLLVRAPDGPLPAQKPVLVKSRSEDLQNGISHVELYAVQLPTGDGNILIRSDEAPFKQSTFTASQGFVPREPGHYVIKVVGYNNIGEMSESEYISFEVTGEK